MDCNFNRVRLCGRISSDPALSHVNHGETFYRFVLSVQRLSGQCDDLPVIVPRQLLRACPLGRGDAAAVTGQLRTGTASDYLRICPDARARQRRTL